MEYRSRFLRALPPGDHYQRLGGPLFAGEPGLYAFGKVCQPSCRVCERGGAKGAARTGADRYQLGHLPRRHGRGMRLASRAMARVNEFRRVGFSKGRSVRLSLYGTLGSFEEQTNAAVWTDLHGAVEDVESKIRCGAEPTADHLEMIRVDPALQGEFVSDYAEVHQQLRHRLPKEFASCHTGHEGSHQFLVDDFVTAVLSGSLPPVHVWQAARYNAPGIMAHESSLKRGEHLAIPDFGWPSDLPLAQGG